MSRGRSVEHHRQLREQRGGRVHDAGAFTVELFNDDNIDGNSGGQVFGQGIATLRAFATASCFSSPFNGIGVRVRGTIDVPAGEFEVRYTSDHSNDHFNACGGSTSGNYTLRLEDQDESQHACNVSSCDTCGEGRVPHTIEVNVNDDGMAFELETIAGDCAQSIVDIEDFVVAPVVDAAVDVTFN